VCLAAAQIATAGGLRLVPGIDVCEAADGIWLRGERFATGLEKRLRSVPGARRFRVLADGQLVAAGTRVPQGWLPEGPWVSLARWLGITIPQPGTAAHLGRTIALELCRVADFQEPSVLLTTIKHWETCADDCPQVRLDRWRFAVAGDGRVLVQGQPLPSLPGQRMVEHEGIAVPVGWFWAPPVDPAVVRALFRLESGDLAVWHSDESWQRISAGDFVRASRAAIRASAKGLRSDGC
jgi:hypothetical protein